MVRKAYLDYDKGDEKIDEAMKNRDALEYFKLSNLYGRTPEIPELYIEGQVEMSNLNSKLEKAVFNVPKPKFRRSPDYKGFCIEGSKLNIYDIGKQIPEKRKLLIKKFPKFSDEGSQPINRLEDAQIGSLFKNIINDSKKRIKQ